MSGKVSDALEQMQSYSALLIGLLFLMAVLALICIFNITVNERLKEFGVLLSIGARKSQIFQMLLLEAGMIGVLGGFLGVVFSGGGILLFKRRDHGKYEYAVSECKCFPICESCIAEPGACGWCQPSCHLICGSQSESYGTI